MEKINKIVGGKVKKMKKKPFFLFPKATKLGTFRRSPSLEPFIGHQAWNLSRATKH